MRIEGMPLGQVLWGTYGKGGIEHCAGTCAKHRLRYKRLVACRTDHLQMILRNQRQVYGNGYAEAIHKILKRRGVRPAKFSHRAEAKMSAAVVSAIIRKQKHAA